MRYTELNEKMTTGGEFNTRRALYHGSDAEFSSFDPQFLRSARHFYTSPDPHTAAFYGKNVYLVHGRGTQADLMDDHELILKLAHAFADDFHDDVNWNEQMNSLRAHIVSELEANGADEDDDLEELAEQDHRYQTALNAAAVQEAYNSITGGRMYERDHTGAFQDSVMDECYSMGYAMVKMHDYNSQGSSISVVFETAENCKIVRVLSDEEINSAQHHMIDESVENSAPADMKTIVKQLKTDPSTGPAFKTKAGDQDFSHLNPAAMMKTMRRLMFNNHEVRKLLDGSTQYKYLLKPTYEGDPHPVVLINILKDFAKIVSGMSNGTMSARAKREVKDFIESHGGRIKPSQATIDELMRIPGLRPDKPVVLYRGLMFTNNRHDNGKTEQQMAPFLTAIRSGKRSMNIEQPGITSWSHSAAVADRFARYRANYGKMDGFLSYMNREKDKKHIDGDLGIIIACVARPEDILIDTTIADLGYNGGGYQEDEVILKPGAKLVRIFVAYNQAGKLDLSGSTEESETEQAIKKVASAANMVDVQTKFVKPAWSSSLDFNPDRVPYCYENRTAIARKALAAYEAIKPAIEGMDARTLDPTTVDPKEAPRLAGLKLVLHYIKDMEKFEGLEQSAPVEYIKNAASPPKRYRSGDGDFFEANRQNLYQAAMRMEGRETHYKDRIPVYYRLKPANQEALLGDLVNKYITNAGKDIPETWEERVKLAYKIIKHCRGVGALIAWYDGLINALIEVEGNNESN